MTELGSAPVPPVGQADHVRGSGAETTLYIDLACPRCAADWDLIRDLPLRLCVRHFPLAGKRPRGPALHAAAEAAAAQGGEEAFWSIWDSLLSDQAYQDDPHLWRRARELDLDLERFEADRRSEAVAERVRRDFTGGIRAGVTGTPAAFVAGEPVAGDVAEALRSLATIG